MSENSETPHGEIAVRTIAMPADTNPWGHIFGGWLMAQMDLAGGTAAQWLAKGRVATVSVDAMSFLKPVNVGDEVSCYSSIAKVGRTSIRVRVEAWVRRMSNGRLEKVTEGMYTFVAVDDNGHPRALIDEM